MVFKTIAFTGSRLEPIRSSLAALYKYDQCDLHNDRFAASLQRSSFMVHLVLRARQSGASYMAKDDVNVTGIVL